MKKPYMEVQASRGSRWNLFNCNCQDRQGPGVMSSPHYHYNRYEMLCGMQGECDVRIDGRKYRMRPGDVIIFEPGQVHEVMALGEYTRYLVYKFSPTVLHPPERESGEMVSYALYNASASPHRSFYGHEQSQTAVLAEFLFKILDECKRIDFGYETAICGYTCLMFSSLMRHWHENDLENSDRMNIKTNAAVVLQNALDYIDKHIPHDVHMEGVARYCCMSYSGFSRFFSRHMNEGFANYVQRKRVINSIYLLMDTDESLSSIAEQMGFSSMSHYCTCFKRYMGMSPGEYRKQKKTDG